MVQHIYRCMYIPSPTLDNSELRVYLLQMETIHKILHGNPPVPMQSVGVESSISSSRQHTSVAGVVGTECIRHSGLGDYSINCVIAIACLTL